MAAAMKNLIGQTLPPVPITYTNRDAILYAIGVGAQDLKYVYEKDESFACLPTYSTCLKLKGDSSDVVPFTAKTAFGEFPGVNFNPAMLLHGEQFTEILKPLPPSGKFVGQGRVANLYDKGKGALLEMEFTISDAKTGEVHTRDIFGMFIRGAGGFGGDKGPSNQNENLPPQRAPDAVVEETTAVNQAQIFRLSGDYNPLHIDPSLAQMVGFPAPILHGLSTYGFAARAVLKAFGENDASRLKSFRVRFANPVMPGDTLVTQMWKEERSGKIIFQTLVKSSGKVALSNCAAEMRSSVAASSSPAAAAPGNELKSGPIFDGMARAISDNKALVDKVKAVYQFNIKAGGKTVTYTVDVKNKDTAGVKSGAQGQADCTITMEDADFVDLASGKLDAMAAFGQGKIKLGGNMMLAQKLSVLTQAAAKL
jgi:3-hydroxyacyl-CoA dehydrogenase/3a,7a,12a-trihydroxy-5b-cholest-24-enoyl-CoA hydratase